MFNVASNPKLWKIMDNDADDTGTGTEALHSLA
jgi:hypothetical protein